MYRMSSQSATISFSGYQTVLADGRGTTLRNPQTLNPHMVQTPRTQDRHLI